MTIAERQAREAHDRENPWRPLHTAQAGGLICDLLFDDLGGHYPIEERHYFLDHDGEWYQLDPPRRVTIKPINWRPAHVKLTPERRAIIKRRDKEWYGS
ncbi:hypothetical protein U8C32_02465 [Sinorhizobium medicae]|uniref:hypothetical protein n=1 Tax=Sinorhizobium medicae TaxID=110321 RepID=UPI002AF6BA2A|nr:hypothetical protein [Sinorhizobium medicae]WQO92506.1 hypothetical protein U8C32_02465 [Sinorhizobium medicae]